tara:strand:- start:471 stop:1340 length:870 start_codon:yes stop_codon:yes gene_type:complete
MEAILILGDPADSQIKDLVSHLSDLPIVYFNGKTISRFKFTRDFSSDKYKVTHLGKPFKPKVIFWRNIYFNHFSCEKDKTNNYLAYFDLFTQSFPDTTWINNPQSFKEHQTKLPQLSKVAKLATIPTTLITNNIFEAFSFLKNYQSIAIKPVCGGDYTKRIDNTADLVTLFSEHKQPLCLQQFIDGDNIRVFVIGDKTFASVLPSDQPDFRTHPCKPIPLKISDEFYQLNIRIANELGLHWTACDWIKKDGTMYFLEANFSPMFSNFQKHTKQPIAKTLADLIKTNFSI